jgi:hypothetical protein
LDQNEDKVSSTDSCKSALTVGNVSVWSRRG